MRGNPLDYDDWAAAGSRAGRSATSPVLELEAYDGPRRGRGADAAAPRRADGPVPVVGGYRLSPIFDSIIAAAEAVGGGLRRRLQLRRQEGISPGAG
ncbi:hypothetical protein QJS66_13255 [Kocuria rhizophila]|nr:hypothetical protein QJS66_13255 [Kocuria rhizophila]